MKVIYIENIKLVSINQKFGMNKLANKLYLNEPYRKLKDQLISACVNTSIKSPYNISIEMSAYVDIDNCIKVILDALQSKGVIDNDKNVLELLVNKKQIKRGRAGSLAVYVYSI